MKKYFATALLLLGILYGKAGNGKEDEINGKVTRELSLPGHLFTNEQAKEIRVSFIVSTDGRAEVTAVNAANKFLCESVKKEIEAIQFSPSQKTEERNMIIRVSLK